MIPAKRARLAPRSLTHTAPSAFLSMDGLVHKPLHWWCAGLKALQLRARSRGGLRKQQCLHYARCQMQHLWESLTLLFTSTTLSSVFNGVLWCRDMFAVRSQYSHGQYRTVVPRETGVSSQREIVCAAWVTWQSWSAVLLHRHELNDLLEWFARRWAGPVSFNNTDVRRTAARRRGRA